MDDKTKALVNRLFLVDVAYDDTIHSDDGKIIGTWFNRHEINRYSRPRDSNWFLVIEKDGIHYLIQSEHEAIELWKSWKAV